MVYKICVQWLLEGEKRMKELRVIIAGSRDFSDYELLKKSAIEIITKKTMLPDLTRIISGGARGADTLGERFANEMGLEISRFIPDWDGLGKRAGYVRNAEMAKFAVEDDNDGMLIAFWDGQSRGTKHMIDLANKYGLEVHVVNYKEKD